MDNEIQVDTLDEEGNVISSTMMQVQEVDTFATREQILHAIETSKL